MAAFVAAVPNKSTGMENGKTMIALNIAPLPRESAPPKALRKLRIKVPRIKLTKSVKIDEVGKSKKITPIIEARRIGDPVIIQ
tara:strand:+ start:578 stop:826 length:249 start_codon:yes stop_codon:yes gene_type:complete